MAAKAVKAAKSVKAARTGAGTGKQERQSAEHSRLVRQNQARTQKAQTQQAEAKQRRPKRFYDYSLLFAVLFISALGLIMVYSSSQYTAALRYNGDSTYLFKRQAQMIGIGLFLALAFSKVDYHLLRKFSKPIYAIAIVLLVATMILGVASHGRTRWIRIAGIQFQPTEPAKIALIVMLSTLISRYGYYINKWKFARIYLLIAFIPTALIGQANLSSGIIMAGITVLMLFVGCRIWWPFLCMGGMALAGLVFTKPIITNWVLKNNITTTGSYQLMRVLAWAMPERFSADSYQTLQGIYAIGSGGVTGQGLGESIQKFGKLPEAQNDMIFAIICEELGLIGAIAVIFIFFFIIYRLMRLAVNAPDLFGSMLCIGIMAHISLQVILNIAVVTNVIPNTGVTLPFISYGGSAVIFTLAEIGIALSVSNRIRLE